MPLQIDGATVGEVRYARPDGSLATVGEARVWDGQWRTVYTSMDTVVITDDGTFYAARDRLRAALTDYGMDYRTVTELPFRLDTSNITNLRYMFQDCSALTSVPGLDTSNVTNMRYMFYDCRSLTSVPEMDTSNVTDMRDMFRGCRSLTSVPEMDTSNVTDMRYMFYNCSALTYVPDMYTSNVDDMREMFRYCSALTDGNVRLIGKHPSVLVTAMISGSGLTRQPFYDTAGNPI